MILRIILSTLSIFLLSDVARCEWQHPHEPALINEENWVNPFEMSASSDKETDVKSNENLNEVRSAAYFKRMINFLLNAVSQRHFDSIYRGHIHLEIDEEDYDTLWNYANRIKDVEMYKIDDVLMRVLRVSPYQSFWDKFNVWIDNIKQALLTKSGISLIVSFSYMFVVYKMLKSRYYFMFILKFVLVNFVVWDFIFVWMDMYQTEEINKLSGLKKFSEMPASCNPKQMNTFEFIWNAFSTEDECQQYYQLIYGDVFFKMNPGKVISEMFSRILMHPAKNLGVALSNFSNALFGKLSWFGTLMMPVTLIFVITIVSITLSFIFGVPIGFNLLHLVSLSFGGTNRSEREELKRLRDFVEQVHIDNDKRNREIKSADCTNCEKCSQVRNLSIEGRIETINEEESGKTQLNKPAEQTNIKSAEEDKKIEVGSGDA